MKDPARKKRYPRCGVCLHPDYTVEQPTLDTPDGRPRFTCTKCGNQWTCGRDGGEFIAQRRPRRSGRDYVIRLGLGGYYSKRHTWRAVPIAKATWFTLAEAEKTRAALARPKMGYHAVIETRPEGKGATPRHPQAQQGPPPLAAPSPQGGLRCCAGPLRDRDDGG